jgi:ATP-dependent helicase HepA
VLISSEIGGEGRNFQFANKLIMGDIPRHPDLVEQRIGRLDRIGQASQIEIFLPYLKGTLEEVLYKWYEDGLKSFTTSWNGTDVFLNEFAEELFATMKAHLPSSSNTKNAKTLLDNLISDTQRHAKYIRAENENSVDLLVDLNSFDQKTGEELLEYVEEADDNPSLEFFIRSMFDHYGVDYDEYDDRGTILVKADSMKFIEKFPGIEQDENTLITFDRDVGLLREDIVFTTGDHPIAEGALSLLLDRNEGVACMAKWENSPHDRGMLVEFSFVFEPSGPRDLELGRFLPILTKELQFNYEGKPLNENRHKDDSSKLIPLGYDDQKPSSDVLKQIVEPIFENAKTKIDEWAEKARQTALKKASSYFEEEISRLTYLNEVNKSVSTTELKIFKEKAEESIDCLKDSTPRLDGVRLIFTS